MMPTPPPRARPEVKWLVAAGLVGFIVGAFVVATLGDRRWMQPTVTKSSDGIVAAALDDAGSPVIEAPAGTSGRAEVPSTGPDAHALAERDLDMPVRGVTAAQLVRSFHDQRGSSREHEAIDILAPRNTPVVAVENGTIAKLFLSKAGGTTIYQFDPSGEYCYYYAHLERYADGLHEGQAVIRGQVIGYVGTSGNAPKNTPHLHFAVFRLTPERHWWEGTPIDPFDILR
jgi:murein DD-endopeptidase MepM/ murein hydrolase activator NlpD